MSCLVFLETEILQAEAAPMHSAGSDRGHASDGSTKLQTFLRLLRAVRGKTGPGHSRRRSGVARRERKPARVLLLEMSIRGRRFRRGKGSRCCPEGPVRPAV